MGCKQEENKQRSYENIKKLANISKEITGQNYVVFLIKENVCGFCQQKEYSEEKGKKIIDV